MQNDDLNILDLDEETKEVAKELTEEEIKERHIKQIKAANGFNTKKHYGVSYKKKRQKKNKQQKKSRSVNRRK